MITAPSIFFLNIVIAIIKEAITKKGSMRKVKKMKKESKGRDEYFWA